MPIPAPVLLLAGAAAAVRYVHVLHAPSERTAEVVLTVALVCILFEGGMHIGVGRFRTAAGAIVSIGVLGTFLTTGAAALLLHLGFGLGWFAALLVATAIAPTDPAVVFSVLGKRQIAGRSGTIIEGESGANDPVGIALMSSLLAAGAVSVHAFGRVGVEFGLQMAVGLAIGLLGGRALLWFMRTVRLPGVGLDPARTFLAAGLLYGIATVAHGSGFLAVFVAGILLGDEAITAEQRIRRFHGALAGVAEIVAFVVLGLTVKLAVLGHHNVWVPGLVLAVVVAFGIRPVLVGLCLLPVRLARNETAFVLFAGLKGAVPLLLGQLMIGKHVHDADRLYGIVVVVVVFSVLVQGSLTPVAARVLRIPMSSTD